MKLQISSMHSDEIGGTRFTHKVVANLRELRFLFGREDCIDVMQVERILPQWDDVGDHVDWEADDEEDGNEGIVFYFDDQLLAKNFLERLLAECRNDKWISPREEAVNQKRRIETAIEDLTQLNSRVLPILQKERIDNPLPNLKEELLLALDRLRWIKKDEQGYTCINRE